MRRFSVDQQTETRKFTEFSIDSVFARGVHGIHAQNAAAVEIVGCVGERRVKSPSICRLTHTPRLHAGVRSLDWRHRGQCRLRKVLARHSI